MSFKDKFKRVAWKYENATAATLLYGALAPVSLLLDPTGGAALFLCGMMVTTSSIDAVKVNVKSEWVNAAGQTMKGKMVHRGIFMDSERAMTDRLMMYKKAKTTKLREECIEAFHESFQVIDMFVNEIEVSNSNGVCQEYRFGYMELPTFHPAHKSQIKALENKAVEKSKTIKKHTGKFGL